MGGNVGVIELVRVVAYYIFLGVVTKLLWDRIVMMVMLKIIVVVA